MRSTDTAVIVSSSFTHRTRKTGKYISEVLGADFFDLKEDSRIDISCYSNIILGSGIHNGKIYAPMVKFLVAHEEELQMKDREVSLFICCIFEGDKGANQLQKVGDKTGIERRIFLSGKTALNEKGFETKLDDFIAPFLPTEESPGDPE